MTTLSHPYLHVKGDLPIPEDKITDVEEFYDWIKNHKNFPKYSKNHAHQFLHACVWNLDAAKSAIENFGKIRAEYPDVFQNRDPLLPSVKTALDDLEMVTLPTVTPEGYRIIVYRIINQDPSTFDFCNVLKAFCMYNDTQLSIDGLVNGYFIIFDMNGFSFGHFLKLKINLLKMYMQYIQEAHPTRLRGVYVINSAWFLNQVMSLVKPFIKSELFSILHFTTNGALDFFEPQYLPKDYGGDLKSLAEYFKAQRNVLETEYRDWLIESGNIHDTINVESTEKKSWGSWFSS